jgi:hypothetical protein
MKSIVITVESNTNYIFETGLKESFNRKLPQMEKFIKDRDFKIKELQYVSTQTLRIITDIKKDS